MDLTIDAKKGTNPGDCFLLVRAGSSRKLLRHGDSCTLAVSAESGNPLGRVDVLRRVGSAPVCPDPGQGWQDVCIPVKDNCGHITLRVSSKPSHEFQDGKQASRRDVASDGCKAQAVEYLVRTDLQDLLTQGIRVLLNEKPDDPRKFLSDWLAPDAEGRGAGNPKDAAKPFTPYTFKPSIGTWLSFLPERESSLLPTEFEVILDRSSGKELGFEVSQPNGATLQISSIGSAGLLHSWARVNRSLGVSVGDHILAVNGVRGDSTKLHEECSKDKLLHLLVKKQSAFNHAIDCQQWLQSLKSSVRWSFQNQQRAITPCQELGEDELSRLLDLYDEDGDGKLSLKEFQKLAREEFWRMTKLPAPEVPAPPAWMTNSPAAATPTDKEEPGYKEPPPKPQTGENLKLGVYKRSDGLALGALSLRYTEHQNVYTKGFVFTVTNSAGESDVGMWSASLEPAGFDKDGRELWRLSGHPSPSVFVVDDGQLLECDLCRVPLTLTSSVSAEGGAHVCGGVRCVSRTRQRNAWAFHQELAGMFFSEPVGLPLEMRSRNFVKAVVARDENTNDESSPDTQTVLKKYARYQKTLPDGPIHRQIELVRAYTLESPLYHEMNRALRDDNLEKMKLFGAYIKELRDVFLTDHDYQIIKPFRGTVWRGISRVPDLEAAKKAYQPGKDFLWTAFTSTTTNKSVAMGWGRIVFEILVEPPEGMYDDEVWEFAPADIREFSAFAGEAEVLFPPNVKFRVIEVREEAGKPLVVCHATALDGLGGQVEFGNSLPCLVEEEPREASGPQALPVVADSGARSAAAAAAQAEADEASKASPEPAPSEGAQRKVLQRVRARPKIGRFVSEAGDVGRLSVQKGRCGRRRGYIFTVVEATEADENPDALWVAGLVHRGHDPRGRDTWALDGHPLGGTFVNDGGNFLECNDDGTVQRHTWTHCEGERESAGLAASTEKSISPKMPGAASMRRFGTFTWDSRTEVS